MAELRIPIIGEFKGKKAFDQAGKSTSTLEKGVKRLGGVLAAAFSAQQVINFGKNAIKAFADNEKSAARLAGVVKNLGLAFETPMIEKNLDEISAKYGYQGEILRESYQKLITVTGSATKSQDLLNLSLDIAAGSGQDLVTVNQDLAALYVGNTKGLKKYNLGLTQAELSTIKYEDAVALLGKTFKGSAGEEIETFSGKMRILGEAAGNAQEIIGKSLVDSLSLLTGEGNSIQPLADAMADFATYIGDAIYGVAVLADKLKALPGAGLIEKAGGGKGLLRYFPNIGPVVQILDYLSNLGKDAKGGAGMGGYPSSALGGVFIDPNEAARKAAEEAAAKRAKELAALQRKNLDVQKKALALQKASKTLNLEAIGIEAALKGKISETDRISLLLQKAILESNATLATQLSDQLEAATKRQNELRALLLTTPEAPNPYRNWTLPQDLLNYTASALGVSVAQLQNAPVAPSSTFSDAQLELMAAVNSFQKADQQAINIEVYLDGDAVGGAVRESSVNSSLSGSFNTVNRVGRFGLSGTQ
jgi:hypothetical protein